MTSRRLASLSGLGLAVLLSLSLSSCSGSSSTTMDASTPDVHATDAKGHQEGAADSPSGEGGHSGVLISAVVPAMEGSILSADHQIYCGFGGSCEAYYPIGTPLTFTEVKSIEYIFKGWGGACASSGTGPTCAFTVSGPATISVDYEVPPLVQLTVMVSGGAGNMVTSSPTGISTSGTETASFPEGTGVTLTATASATGGQAFTKWVGGQCGVGTAATKCKCALGIGATADTETAMFGPCSYPCPMCF
jgi:hypothetical protein